MPHMKPKKPDCRRTHKDITGYANLHTIYGARKFNYVVKCLESFPFQVSQMQQADSEKNAWSCVYTDTYANNFGQLVAVWNTDADQAHHDCEHPLRVDQNIHSQITKWFNSKGRILSQNKKKKATQPNYSNYWAKESKSRWSKEDFLGYIIDQGFVNAKLYHENEGVINDRYTIKLDEDKCSGAIIWTKKSRVGADGNSNGSSWNFDRKALVKGLMAMSEPIKTKKNQDHYNGQQLASLPPRLHNQIWQVNGRK